MYNKINQNKRVGNSFLQGEKTVFKPATVTYQPPKPAPTPKEKLPKPVLSRRQEKDLSTWLFYSVMFFISLSSMGLQLYHAHFGSFISSLFAALCCLYGLFFTEPTRWQDKKRGLAFWNASVTLSVLIKSLHFRMFQWRNIFMWGLAVGIGLSYFISPSMNGLLSGLYVLIGIFFFATRQFDFYKDITLILAWLSIPSILFFLILVKGFPLETAIVGLMFYQVYERLRDLEIEEPYVEE